jgi:hypothetical protein
MHVQYNTNAALVRLKHWLTWENQHENAQEKQRKNSHLSDLLRRLETCKANGDAAELYTWKVQGRGEDCEEQISNCVTCIAMEVKLWHYESAATWWCRYLLGQKVIRWVRKF